MSLKKALLEVLSDGQFHSGEQLGKDLGISRTAVWKHVQNLQREGVRLERVRGKGYRLEGPADRLDAARIRAGLLPEAASLLTDLVVFDSIDSTNQRALGKPRGFVCLAEQQTGGRGRLGRAWQSPYGQNIYMSIVWEFSAGAASLEGLSLAIGNAVADALQQAGVDDLQLKWPNDIHWQGHKLAGILLELFGDAAGMCSVVVGLGVNVHMLEDVSGAIDQPWTSVDQLLEQPAERNRLVALCLNRILPLLADYQDAGFGLHREAWQLRDCLAGQPVVLHMGERQLAGVARGVDGRGQLLLETPLGLQPFAGGEISVRASSDS